MSTPAPIELKATTADEYLKLTTKLVRVSSGRVYRVKAMGISSNVKYLNLMPRETIKDKDKIKEFVLAKSEDLAKFVVLPNIIEPKVTEDTIIMADALELLTAIAELTGLGPEQLEEKESFRKE